jgi:hypothetical protein
MVIVHDQFVPFLRACGKAEYHGIRSVWWRRLLTSKWPGSKNKGTERAQGKICSSKICSQ